MLSMFDTGLRAAAQGGNYDKARALANAKLEEIKTRSYSQVVTSYPPTNGPASGGSVACSAPVETGFGCQVRTNYVSVGAAGITADSSARTMMEVMVTVTGDLVTRTVRLVWYRNEHQDQTVVT